MITFPRLFFFICILTMGSGAAILMPLGIYMASLSCLFLNLAGFLVFITGFLLFAVLLRLDLKSKCL